MNRIRLVLVAALILGSAGVSHASINDNSLQVDFNLGFAGAASDEDFDADLAATPGIGVGWDIVLGERFALKPFARVAFWKYDQDLIEDDRHTFIDVGVASRLRFPMSDTWELYGSVPFGFTANLIKDADETGKGFNIGTFFGARFLMGEVVGLFAEVGWQMRWSSFGDDITEKYNQGALHAGVSF
ncbi:MAG: outer membrane beta-barrel protein [Myxococcota bacterium]